MDRNGHDAGLRKDVFCTRSLDKADDLAFRQCLAVSAGVSDLGQDQEF